MTMPLLNSLRGRRGRPILLAAWLLSVFGASGLASAQSGDSLLQGFERTEDYVLEIDGQRDENAEVYYQRTIPAFLVLPAEAVTPLLLVPRTQTIQSVNVMKIARQSDGSLDLMPDAVFDQKGQFKIEGTAIVFQADGRSLRLRDKPALLGLHPGSALGQYAASYARLADGYTPNAAAISALEAENREVHVRVYFGSWCPFCQRYVPRMVRVAKDLVASKIDIDFYGLPAGISSDPVAGQMNIKGVPTAVVFVAGKEAGRIQSEDWKEPEQALRKILGR